MSGPPFDNTAFALSFETSGAIGEVALARGQDVIARVRFHKRRAHATEFLPAIESLCRDHRVEPRQVRLVYVSAGPGSFTGLRIGITAARMIALAQEATIVAVPTLEVIAQNALLAPDPPQEIAVVLDAKRKRVYAASFQLEGDRYHATCKPAEVDPRAFLETCSPNCHVLGEGVPYHRGAILAAQRPLLPDACYPPRAATVALLGYQKAQQGKVVDPRHLTPVYIRPPEAEEKWAAANPNTPR